MIEDFRTYILYKMETVKTDPYLTKEEKDNKIIELARMLGKAILEKAIPEDFRT